MGAVLRLGIAGAESNVAVGVSRLGGAVTWIGRVREDDLGEVILRELRAEGVTTLAVLDPAPTSLLLKERRTATHSRVTYYRTGTAGGRLSPQDIPVPAHVHTRPLARPAQSLGSEGARPWAVGVHGDRPCAEAVGEDIAALIAGIGVLGPRQDRERSDRGLSVQEVSTKRTDHA